MCKIHSELTTTVPGTSVPLTKDNSMSNWIKDTRYLEVKQVPFLYVVEPVDKELVLTHASFLKFTTVNNENTARSIIIK